MKILKEDRKKQIKERIREIVDVRERLRKEKKDLNTELDFINNNYNITWEERYKDRRSDQ